ncbi:MAG: carbohydrate binding family 9 domain-containing protein [Candidatus Zixiibacteriota bacterium]|nr:MAG: carbohydrate binding family 9 domain-containing protein [candidate division Zixibacteria bacterium]
MGNGIYCICALFLLLSITVVPGPLQAESPPEWKPVYHPKLQANPAPGEISVDGDLSDPGWRGAAEAGNFAEHQPGDQTQPPVDTRALITYDSDKLYVAFVCYDNPKSVRASHCERDRNFSDDNVVLALDTYADAAWLYELVVNPYGVQGDLLWSRSGDEDAGYDLIWESAGKITDSGYQVEMAVPFSSLRFPDKEEQVWMVDFWRNHPRDVLGQYSWAAYDRDEDCWPCQFGTVTGIRGVRSGKGIEIIPAILGYQSGALEDPDNPGATFVNDDPDGEISVTGKYAIASDMVAEISFNPDFSQVEADPDQIDVNTNFALFYSERRPFFQEGSDLFGTIFNTVYTRSINNPDFTAKFTARKERTSVAYLMAHDEDSPIILPFEESSNILLGGKSISNIFRVRRTFGENSHGGIVLTDRRFEGGGSGTLLGIDGKAYLSKKYSLAWQAIVTHSEEPTDSSLTFDESYPAFHTMTFDDGRYTAGFNGESFWGHAGYLDLARATRNNYVGLTYYEYSPTFRSYNGFEPSNNRRFVGSLARYYFWIDGDLFQRVITSAMAGRVWNFNGEVKDSYIYGSIESKLAIAQLNNHTQFGRMSQRWGGVDFDDLWEVHTCISAQPSELVGFSSGYTYRQTAALREYPPVVGRETTVQASLDVKPARRLLIENTYTYLKSVDRDSERKLYEGFVIRSRWNLQLTKALSVRLVGQYNRFGKTFDLDPLITYRLSPFSVFYAGSTYDYCTFDSPAVSGTDARTCMTSRQFFMKLQYLFQI